VATYQNWHSRTVKHGIALELVFLVIPVVALQKLINQGLFASLTLRYNPAAFLSADTA
jgi:hypothetical protein